MRARTVAGHRVRLVAFRALFANCPYCGGFMVAVGKLAIEVDGIEPCNRCCAALIGQQRFAELCLAAS